MLISVCLPVRNGEKFLAQCIESILNQTYAQFELLIVDDCSSDRSAEIIHRYAENDRRITHWKTTGPKGKYACYNECFSRASGIFIKPLEQSSKLYPSMLEKLSFKLASNCSLAMVSSRANFTDRLDLIAKQSHFVYTDRFIALQNLIENNLLSLASFVDSPSSVLFRSTSVADGFDLDLDHYCELDFWMRILVYGYLWVSGEVLLDELVANESEGRSSQIDLSRFTELITLSRKCSWFLKAFQYDESRFVESAISSLAAEISPQAMQPPPTFSSVQGGCSIPSAESVNQVLPEKEKLHTLTKLFCHTVRALRPHAREYQEKNSSIRQRIRNEITISRLERTLRAMLSSPSWKITRGLRDANRLVTSRDVVDSRKLDEADYKDLTTKEQITYIKWLRRQIAAVKTSRSWKLSYPLRILDSTPKVSARTSPVTGIPE